MIKCRNLSQAAVMQYGSPVELRTLDKLREKFSFLLLKQSSHKTGNAAYISFNSSCRASFWHLADQFDLGQLFKL